MSRITIDSQEYKFHVSTSGGWEPCVGHLAKIDELQVAVYVAPCLVVFYRLVVSELTSGAAIYKKQIGYEEIEKAYTKEGFSDLVHDFLEETADLLERVGKDKVEAEIKRKKEFVLEKWGGNPGVEKYEVEVAE